MSGNINNSDAKILVKFIKPSSTSVFIICFMVIIAGGIAFCFARYKSVVPQSMQSIDFLYHSTKLVPTAHDVGNDIANNSYLKNSPLFIFWCFVGLICYSIVEALIKGAKNAEDVADEFRFVNIKKEGVIRYVFIRTVIRVFALLILLLLFRYTLFVVAPHFITSIQTWAAASLTNFSHIISATEYILLAFLCTFGLVVCIRFIFLRPRLFGSDIIF